MSEGPGDDTSVDRFFRTVIDPDPRTFFAWILAAAIGTGVSFGISMAFEYPSENAYAAAMLLLRAVFGWALAGAIIGSFPAWLVGVLIHAWLRKAGWTHPLVYVGFGGLVGAIAIMAVAMLLYGFPRSSPDSVPFSLDSVLRLARLAIPGLIGGGVFWLIRRPDRDPRPTLSPEAAHV